MILVLVHTMSHVTMSIEYNCTQHSVDRTLLQIKNRQVESGDDKRSCISSESSHCSNYRRHRGPFRPLVDREAMRRAYVVFRKKVRPAMKC